jgi:Flp pilus assembly protein CpaB
VLVVIGVVLFVAGGAIAFATVVTGSTHQSGTTTVAPVNTPVVVATANIPAGTTGQSMVSESLVSIQLIPRTLYEPEDLTTLSGLTDEVLTAPVLKGDALRSTEVTASTSAISLPKGLDAVTVTMDGVSGLAGYLQPGSRVDVYANITKLSAIPGTQTYEPEIPIPCTELTMTNIEVLDVSSAVPAFSTHPSSAGRTVPGSMTLLLAVTPAQARTITFMTLNEALSVVQTQKGTLPPTIGQCESTALNTAA